MPEKKPTNLFEAIFYGVKVTNENVIEISKTLKDVADKVFAMQEQVNHIMAVFNQPAPEQPNAASGNEGAVTETVGSATNN